MCVPGYDPLTFSFLSSFLFFDWVGVLWPHLSEMLKLARWFRSCERVPDEIKSREVELDCQVSPEEIMSREVELDFFRFGLSL